MTSHRAATRLVQLIGVDHDALVKKWRDQLAEDLKHKVLYRWGVKGIRKLQGVLNRGWRQQCLFAGKNATIIFMFTG